MDITFSCSKCGQSLTIDDAGAGVAIQCPKCGESLTVPAEVQPPPEPSSTKQCPFCAETIKAEATICRFCGRDVVAGQPTKQTVDAGAPRASSRVPKILGSLLLIALLIGGGVLAYRKYQYENSDTDYWRNLRGATYERQKRADAEAGDALAQELLAFDYEHSKDYAEAAKWFRKSADHGNALSQEKLAEFYREGKGVLQDYAEAEKWQHKAVESYRKTAEQGDASAQRSLGRAYEYGAGVETNYAEAVKWYRKAAEGRGMPQWDAQFSLGECYKEGKGVEQDTVEAYKWYNLAAAHGKLSPALAVMERDELAQSMTAEQIAEGQRRASELAAKMTTESR